MLYVSNPECWPKPRSFPTHIGVPDSAQIQAAHENLLKAMADMAIATQAPSPDREKYTTARWQLSKASRRRRDLWQEVCAFLSARVGQAELEVLSRLAVSNEELRRASTAHIGLWSSEAIERDWEGYCEASRTIRWKMMSIVRHERRDVLPILERLKRGT